MRILTVTGNLELGGTQRAAQNFTLAYQRAGHEVGMLAYDAGGVRGAMLESRGVRVWVGGGDIEACGRAADEFRPELIHIHRPGAENRHESLLLKRLAATGRRILETNVFGRVDYSEGAEQIDVHLQLSAWCMWRWRRCLGSDRDRRAGVIVPYAVDPADFQPAPAAEVAAFRHDNGIPQSAYVCARIGQPSPAKWHPANLTAFAEIARLDSQAHLLLVGLPESLRPVLNSFPPDTRRRVRELSMTHDDYQLSVIYSAADCFLHAAASGESFGLVLTEAMLCGCPVVTASRPGRDNSQLEVVGHRQGGLVAASANDLPAAAVELWKDVELRKQLRSQARKRVIDLFDADAVAAKAVQVGVIALASRNRAELMTNLDAAPGLQTNASETQMRALLKTAIGRPRIRERLLMQLLYTRTAQRSLEVAKRLRRAR